MPTTISGLWALHPLTPIKTAKDYEVASVLCTRLALRRLKGVQKEYFRELTELVEGYEDEHGLLDKTERGLRALTAKG
ncbi:MAG: hypothetical protein U0984_13610 [Prosthecobacter sp.]|nr:hypothetical protein [Prosthecobacter sp.]